MIVFELFYQSSSEVHVYWELMFVLVMVIRIFDSLKNKLFVIISVKLDQSIAQCVLPVTIATRKASRAVICVNRASSPETRDLTIAPTAQRDTTAGEECFYNLT